MSALAISLIPIPAFVTCCTAASSKHWGEEAWVWYKAGLFAGQSFALLRVGPENGAGGVAWEWCWGCGLGMVLGVWPGNGAGGMALEWCWGWDLEMALGVWPGNGAGGVA